VKALKVLQILIRKPDAKLIVLQFETGFESERAFNSFLSRVFHLRGSQIKMNVKGALRNLLNAYPTMRTLKTVEKQRKEIAGFCS
jgi:hypothetical protein